MSRGIRATACSCCEQAVWRTRMPAERRLCSRLGRNSSSGARPAVSSAPRGRQSRGLTTTSNAENKYSKALSSSWLALATPAADTQRTGEAEIKEATCGSGSACTSLLRLQRAPCLSLPRTERRSENAAAQHQDSVHLRRPLQVQLQPRQADGKPPGTHPAQRR